MHFDLARLSHRLLITFALVLLLAGIFYAAAGNATMITAGAVLFVALTSGVWILGLHRARSRKRSVRLSRDPARLVATTREYINHVNDTFDGRTVASIGQATQAIILSIMRHIEKGTYKNERMAARALHLMSDDEFAESRDPRKIAITLVHLYYLGLAAGGQTADDVTALVDNLIVGIKDHNL
jgi:hypothetical protein